jgi:aspartyl-tRNA(Asn)/glutamyl-tRNA(Gln) amidotransferase subunit C
MLTTKRLTLRRFTIEDAEGIYYNWAGDPEVTKYLTWTAHKSVEESEEFIKNLKAGYEKDSYYMWAIELNETEQPIGCIGASGIQEEIDAVELAFFLGKDYWHQGYTTEALTEVVRFFFEEVGANRIWCTHDTENIYSGKVMQACGFTLEGICKKAGKTNNGIADIAIYAVLKQAQDDEEEEEVFEPADTTVTKVVAEDGTVKNVISDETMEYVGILAKLELNEEESETAKKDMEAMLDYIDQLNELDTTGVEPMSHVFPVQNVFREDVVTNGDGSADTLSNAPQQKDGGFKVPKTIGE